MNTMAAKARPEALRSAADKSEPMRPNPGPMRGRYQGVLQILRFNWSMYAATAGAMCAAACAWPLLPARGQTALLICAAPTLFWTIASLAVSHYVYDCSPLYDLSWLATALKRAPRRWINIHAGWDETSGLLNAVFPGAVGEALDLFDRRVMTEASIRRAQRWNRPAILTTPARYDTLPLETCTVDTAFLIFAAHELRRPEQRVKLFAEIARVIKPGGECVLVEHLRSGWNFLAFGPGFLHFFSRREWLRVARQAGFDVRSEIELTRLVRGFVLRRVR